MKKILFVFCLLASCLSISAQKSYVYMICRSTTSYYYYSDNIELSGDLPIGLNKHGDIGSVLNFLAKEGFVIEQHCMAVDENYLYKTFVLSKTTETPSSMVQSVEVDDKDVVEVARYNLQGIPVKENEKGVQIIVYSNYTTKTVIVQ